MLMTDCIINKAKAWFQNMGSKLMRPNDPTFGTVKKNCGTLSSTSNFLANKVFIAKSTVLGKFRYVYCFCCYLYF